MVKKIAKRDSWVVRHKKALIIISIILALLLSFDLGPYGGYKTDAIKMWSLGASAILSGSAIGIALVMILRRHKIVVKTEDSVGKKHRIRRNMIIAGMIFVLLLAFDISPFGGNIRFYAKWIECGQKPVGTLLGDQNSLWGIPNYYNPTLFRALDGSMTYFCTPLDAEKAGFSADPKMESFPHLKHRQ